MSVSQSKLIQWVMKGGLAILDQGLLTGSNFFIGILLARWLSPEQYGTYAIAFAVFLLLLMLYQALILEPMLVFGGSVYRNSVRSYLRSLLLTHVAMSVLMVFTLGIAVAITFEVSKSSSLPGALAGVAIGAPFVLLFWLVKRTFYIMLSPAASVWGALFYCVLAIGGLTLVSKYSALSPFFALLLMGFAGAGAAIVLLVYVGFRLPRNHDALSLADVWRRHWRYGKWALGANIMMWVPVSIYYPLLSSFFGAAEAGELKALMNFLSPVLQTCAALASLMIPYATRLLEERGTSSINSVSRRMTVLCVSLAIPYWVVVLLFQGTAFRVLYSGQYTQVAYLLPFIAFTSIVGSAFFGPLIALRAVGSPGSVFGAVCVAGVASVAIGVPATWAFGLRGAVLSMALSEAVAFIAGLFLLRRKGRTFSESAPGVPILSATN